MKQTESVAHASTSIGNDVPTPVPTPAPAPTPVPAANTSVEFERYQKYPSLVEATKDLDVGYAQVGNLIEKKCILRLCRISLQSGSCLILTNCI